MLDQPRQLEIYAGGLRNRMANSSAVAESRAVSVDRNKMHILQEKFFCPVPAMTRFRDIDDAIKVGSDSIYGLGAGVCPAIMIVRFGPAAKS